MQIPQGKLENKNVGRIYAQNIDMVKSFKRKYNKKENFTNNSKLTVKLKVPIILAAMQEQII